VGNIFIEMDDIVDLNKNSFLNMESVFLVCKINLVFNYTSDNKKLTLFILQTKKTLSIFKKLFLFKSTISSISIKIFPTKSLTMCFV
jgi:hypothetical protein